MQVGEPVSMASTDASLVSPPPQVIEEIFVSDLFAAPFKLSAPTSQRASQSTTANGSFVRRFETSETLQTQSQSTQTQEFRDRFHLNSLERSENIEGATVTGRKTDGNETPFRLPGNENSAQKPVSKADYNAAMQTMDTNQKNTRNVANTDKEEAKNQDKRWYDMLPVVLENIKTYNREQIRQLSLPRCTKCERVRDEHKAVIRCKEKDCIAVDRPLCLMCWESYHESVEARKHRGQHTSACPQCQLDLVVYWCAECDLKFCKKCFVQIHSVSATVSHRKIATEDAAGTCLVTSHWSANFRNVIVHMIASRKQKINSTAGGSSIGAKRKRDIEVIVIDDDDDDDDEDEDEEEEVSQRNRSSTGRENGGMRRSDADTQLQQNALANTNSQASTNQESAKTRLKPLTSLSQQTGSAYSTSPTSNGTNTVNNVGTGVGSLQWDASTFQSGSSSQMRDSSTTTASATSVTGNGMMQVTRGSIPTVVNTTSGSLSTRPAIRPNLASTSHFNGHLPVGGAVSAENALSDSLVGHYHEVNQNVAKMELQSEQLNRQTALTTYQGPYRAGPIMALLNLQPVLEAAKKRRDQLLTAIIIQSKDIMTSVRLLRLVELGDVPEIPRIGHRTCLELTNEINRHKKSLSKLYQQFGEALNHSASSWEDLHTRTIRANIHMHEKNVKKLKKARDAEFVRIVQFSYNVREALKQAFQRQQLHRQQSQFQPSG